MRLRTSVMVTIGATLLAAACDRAASGAGPQPDHADVVEQQAVRVVDNVGEGLWSGDTPWNIREVFTIGVVDGAAPYEFVRISSVDVDGDGNIYVLDAGHRRVRKYSRTGRFLVEMGGDGGGPSEFAFAPPGMPFGLGGMALVGDSLVVVHDPWAWKLVYFDRRGEFHHDVSLQDLSPPRRILDRISDRLADLGGGWLLFEHRGSYGSGKMKSTTDGQHALVRVASDGSARDTLVAYYQDDAIHDWLDDFHAESFPKPFPARWHWAVAPTGQIALGHGRNYEITVYTGSWEPRARMTRGVMPRNVTDADIADFRRRFPFGGGMDALSPRMLRVAESILGDLEFPSSWPFFDDLAYDDVGRLWVRRPPRRDDAEVEWDIFDVELRYLGSVRLPSNLVVLKITTDRIYSRVHDDLGVHFLKVYEIFPADA